jgi:hypothetical protein
VAYCTVVELTFEDSTQSEAFRSLVAGDATVVEGRLVRVVGVDEHGARAIEVWSSPDDARRHAERTAPRLDGVALPAPTRVFGFEVTTLEIAG